MKTRQVGPFGIVGIVLAGSVLMNNGDELAANFRKAANLGQELVCVGQEATMGIVTLGAVDCSAAGTGTKTTPATPTGPSDATGN